MSLVEAVLRRQRENPDALLGWTVEDPVRVRRKRHWTGGRKRTCECGTCRKCRRREWMANRRAGRPTARNLRCERCGKRRYGEEGPVWCHRCRSQAPAAYRKALGQTFTDAGGI